MYKPEKEREKEGADKFRAKSKPEAKSKWQDKRNIKGEKKAQDNAKPMKGEGINRVKMRKGDLVKGQGGKMKA